MTFKKLVEERSTDSGSAKRIQTENPRYFVVVYDYMANQKRIVLCDSTRRYEDNIVREMCTYSAEMMWAVLTLLSFSDQPYRLANRLATLHNCEGPGMRIRLDTQRVHYPETRYVDGMVHQFTGEGVIFCESDPQQVKCSRSVSAVTCPVCLQIHEELMDCVFKELE